MRLLDRFRTTRGRFALWVGLALVPLLVLWWLASAPLIALFRAPTGLLASLLQVAVSVDLGQHQDWLADSGLLRASGTEAGKVILVVPGEELRRMLLSFPLFLAFVIAPPRPRPIRTLMIGAVVLSVVFCFSAFAIIFNGFAVVVNHRSSIVADNVPPPDFTVTHAPLGDGLFFLAGLSLYLGLQVLPLAVPVGLWAWLNRDGVKQLMTGDGADERPVEAEAAPETAG